MIPATRSVSFHTTRWTQVRCAKADSEDGRMALADLCDAYYEPVFAFLKCELRDKDAARELTHDFFASMLSGGAIRAAERDFGRFRSYLLGAVKHFLSHQREAAQRLKRGGGMVPVSLDEDASAVREIPAAQTLSPEAAFDRQWAVTVLAHALETLRRECTADGKLAFCEQVKPWLTGEAAHGDQSELAAACGMTPAALKMAVQRLKKRFRDCVKAEVAGTLEDAAMVAEEMLSLQAALAG
jgi:DNA-directed RNA polymerase specialized sigma24 family protein